MDIDIEKPKIDNVTVQWLFQKSLDGTFFISPVSLDFCVLTPESLLLSDTNNSISVSKPQEVIRLVRIYLLYCLFVLFKRILLFDLRVLMQILGLRFRN